MNIIVNGEECAVECATLAELLEQLDYAERGVATAVNGQFVAIRLRAVTTLAAGDVVDIVAPMSGG